ncbi:hypothetical protein [uncultured Muribaculum sp.]|nr:hypothetical protein [uncultured Muribaculum sp.]
MSNPNCRNCANTVKTVNGLYCRILKRLVEHCADNPPCKVSTIKISPK